MNKRLTFAIFGTFILLALASVSGVFSTATIGGQTCEKKIAEPLMGSVTCAPLESGSQSFYHDDWIKEDIVGGLFGSQYTIFDGCRANTPECDYYLETNSNSAENLQYRTCDADRRDCGAWRNIQDRASSGQNIFIDTVTVGGGIEFRANGPSTGINWDLRETFQPYGLKVEDPTTGISWLSRSSCNFDNLDQDKVPADYDRSKIDSGVLLYGETINYRTSWNLLDLELGVEQYNSEDVWCGGSSIYNIDTFDTAAGSCYFTVGSKIRDVECCPGFRTTTKVCNDNFQFEEIEGSECDTSFDCPGAGSYVVDYDDTDRNSVIQYGCNNGFCEITDSKTVDCTYDGQCPSGEICESYSCVEGQGELEPCNNLADGDCQAGCPEDPDCQAVCGNGECEQPPEDKDNCPSDCGEPGILGWLQNNLGPYLLWILGGYTSLLAALIFYSRSQGLDNKIRYGIVLGIFVGILAFTFVISWIPVLILGAILTVIEYLV